MVALPDEADEGSGDHEMDMLQGGWQVVGIERPGSPGNPDELARARIVFDGNCVRIMDGERQVWEGEFRLEPTAEPKAIDFTGTADPHKGEKAFGIYRVEEEDALTICVGKERPTEFSGKEAILIELSHRRPAAEGV
jgi:uncharacterized protein (TIGR03067 family)